MVNSVAIHKQNLGYRTSVRVIHSQYHLLRSPTRGKYRYYLITVVSGFRANFGPLLAPSSLHELNGELELDLLSRTQSTESWKFCLEL